MRKALRALAVMTVCTVSMGSVPSAAGAEQALADHAAMATWVVETSGTSHGICSFLGCKNPKVVLELTRQSDFLLHVWEPDGSAAAAARQVLDAEGLCGRGVIVEQGRLNQLPYADNMVDLVTCLDLTHKMLNEIRPSEVLRVLRPGGKALLGRQAASQTSDGGLTRARIEQWLRQSGAGDWGVVEEKAGLWARTIKPPPAGTDDWSHWEHGPDNNPVSNDVVIKAPYMTQWLGQPYYIAMPAISTASAGRIFIAMGHIAHHQREEQWLNTLMANNGYNGITLWTRKLPDGYLAHRSAFVATPDTFYMIDHDGTGCLLLDPDTGEQKDRIRIPQVRGYWKWIALQDGLLFALVGKDSDRPETTVVRSQYPAWSWGELSKGYYEPRVPWGFGTSLLAYDVRERRLLWVHKEDKPVDSRAMVLGGGRVFFYGPDSRIGCLDAKTGALQWTNDDPNLRAMINEPGRGLSSTPGFKTSCYALYTPKALFYEAQTQMNVVAVSLKDGGLLWYRKKTTSNPNMIYVDDRLLVGVGPEGDTLVLDPMTGKTVENLGFRKRSCARLTATPDSLFCRGYPEGLTRYDRITKKILFNGAFRPSCNDGVIAASGLLYAGPWACDCNLSLMGRIAMCSATTFVFDRRATETERLEIGTGDITRVAPFETSPKDWATYRGGIARNGSIDAKVSAGALKVWQYVPEQPLQPTAPTAAGGLVFLSGSDGKVRAIDGASGTLKWTFLTAGPVLQPPTLWNGRAYVGSGDGYVYALEATTGRLLWRFRAAPIARRIMAYGALSSTWPVHTGVLVKDGIACAAAGIIDYDGTYVYALDAITGRITWQNVTSGHLDGRLRKGVSAQGILTVADGRLWMPGGNVVSPASYDINTGEYTGSSAGNGSPRSNRGEEIGLLADGWLMLGGRLRFSARENVVDPGSFIALSVGSNGPMGKTLPLSPGKIPPAWNDRYLVMVEGRSTPPTCWRVDTLNDYLKRGDPKTRPQPLWRADWLQQADIVALAIASDSILAVCESSRPRQLASRWRICCMKAEDGRRVWERDLPSPGMAGGLMVDRDGGIIVVMTDGSVACYGGEKAIQDYVSRMTAGAPDSEVGRRQAIAVLLAALEREPSGEARRSLAERLVRLGYDPAVQSRRRGWVTDWHMLGPVPWDTSSNPIDRVLVGEPTVDIHRECSVSGKNLRWQPYVLDDPSGKIDLCEKYGELENVAMYAYAEVLLPQAADVMLKIGSNDGFKCWFNDKEVGRYDGGRTYQPDNDALKVRAKKGLNKVLLKVTQMGGEWAMSARITDEANRPIDLNAP